MKKNKSKQSFVYCLVFPVFLSIALIYRGLILKVKHILLLKYTKLFQPPLLFLSFDVSMREPQNQMDLLLFKL